MSEHYRVLRKSTATSGDFLPASEGGGPCKAFALSGVGTALITTSHGVTFTARTTAEESFKIFPISAVSWSSGGSIEKITLF